MPKSCEQVFIEYTNWNGARKTYIVIPTGRVIFENNEWHPDSQWFIEATVVDKGFIRLFPIKDIHYWEPLP